MTLLESSTLKKITVAILALALVSWLGVGLYRLKTNLTVPSTTVPPPTGATSSTEIKALLEKITSLTAVAGSFKGWQKLKDSQDRYLYLGETVFSSSQQELTSSRIRVIFESKDSTLLAVEENGREETIGYLKDMALGQVEGLIKPGDFIKVFFKKQPGGTENLKDDEGNFLAEKILLQ